MHQSEALAAIALVGITLLGAAFLVSENFGTDSGSPPCCAQGQWQVVKNNITVSGRMAFEVTCNVFMASCLPECCTSISGIQLVTYRGAYYYVRNTAVATNPGPTTTMISTGQDGKVTTTIEAGTNKSSEPVTIWFTNSTVYCISPSEWPNGNAWGVSAPSCP